MDAAQALADLREISTQVDVAVIVDDTAGILGSTHGSPEALADTATALLERAKHAHDGDVSQLEVATPAGSIFVVREGTRTIVARTAPDPTSGLVVYDLKTALRALDPPTPKRKRTPRKRPADAS